jgi:hypothetical protein
MSTYVGLVLGCQQVTPSSSNGFIVSNDSKIARESHLP